jgi:hypothetical protein
MVYSVKTNWLNEPTNWLSQIQLESEITNLLFVSINLFLWCIVLFYSLISSAGGREPYTKQKRHQ